MNKIFLFIVLIVLSCTVVGGSYTTSMCFDVSAGQKSIDVGASDVSYSISADFEGNNPFEVSTTDGLVETFAENLVDELDGEASETTIEVDSVTVDGEELSVGEGEASVSEGSITAGDINIDTGEGVPSMQTPETGGG